MEKHDTTDTHADDLRAFLTTSMRSKLWLKLHRKRLREGQHLLHHGETGDTLYLVCEGELAEFSRDEHGNPLLLDLIDPGDVICEDKLFKPGVHKTDIIANKSSIVVKFSRKKLTAALLDNPALNIALQRKAEHRRMLAAISASPILQTIPLQMRRHLATRGYMQHYAAGVAIHKAGEQLQYVDLIVHGEACYQLQGEGLVKELKPLKPGALIGETAAVLGSGCPADIVTYHGVSIFHMPYTEFVNVVEAFPPLKNSLTTYAEKQRALLMRKLDELQVQELNPASPEPN